VSDHLVVPATGQLHVKEIPMSAHEGLIVMSSAELDGYIRTAVREAVEAAATFPTREFLTPEQLAQRLGVCTKSIKTMVSRDGMPAHTVGPRMQRFQWSEVESWLVSRGKNLEPGTASSNGNPRRLRRIRSLK
jgi:excisionase family DNA binding protein